MSILIWIIIISKKKKKKKCLALLHYVMYTLTTGNRAHVTPLLLMPPAKRWSGPILYTARVFVDPTSGVPFKILSPPVRAAIIEYAQVEKDDGVIQNLFFF